MKDHLFAIQTEQDYARYSSSFLCDYFIAVFKSSG